MQYLEQEQLKMKEIVEDLQFKLEELRRHMPKKVTQNALHTRSARGPNHSHFPPPFTQIHSNSLKSNICVPIHSQAMEKMEQEQRLAADRDGQAASADTSKKKKGQGGGCCIS